MFKKLALVAATSVLFIAGQASAAVTPTGPITVTVSGTVSQSVTLTCTKTFNATVSGSTITVHATGQNFGSGTCALVTFTSDWVVATTPTASGGTLNVTNVNANTLTGTCAQTGANVISGAWTNGSPGSGAVAGSISGTSLGSPRACNLNLRLTTTPNVTIS